MAMSKGRPGYKAGYETNLEDHSDEPLLLEGAGIPEQQL